MPKTEKDYLEEEISNYLYNGKNETNLVLARKQFELAINKAKESIPLNNYICLYYLQGLEELGKLQISISSRVEIWNKLFFESIKFLNKFENEERIILAISDRLVSIIQEPFIGKNYSEIKSGLSIIISKIDKLIVNKGVNNSVELLEKKATILRNSISYQPTIENQKAMLERAFRCVKKSIELNPKSWYSLLELGNCYYKASEFEKDVTKYNDAINMAESCYKESISLELTVYNSFALCWMYKLTYQTAPFLEAYTTYEKVERDRRNYLANSYLIAETSIRMYYGNFPEKILNDYIDKSDKLLSEAISAGYSNARLITNLAFIKAIKGEKNVGEYILSTLKVGKNEKFNWNNVVEDISKIKEGDDLLAKGFVLGIDDDAIWNKLGTFSLTFMDNPDLAIKMYEVAYNYNHNNPITLTNLARAMLIYELNEDNINELEYYISKAASSSNHRFQWWRNIRSEFEEKKSSILDSKILRTKSNYNFTKISDLYKLFVDLKNSDIPIERGFEFEKLITSFFNISLGNSHPSYRIKSHRTEQIDSAFTFDKEFYRVEVKWTKKPIDHTDIQNFYFKIQTKGVSGLFISFNGFTRSAIETAKQLKNEVRMLLMDGSEIEFALRGNPTLDEAIRLKQLYFLKEDNPYYIITNQGDFTQ